MDIIVTSRDQDPADFNANYIDSININEGYEIALKSIFHAPVYNITTANNRFSVAKSNDHGTEIMLNLSIAHFEIPAGFYESRCEIMAAMHKAISDTISGLQIGFGSTNPHDREILDYAPVFSVDNGTITLDMVNPKKNASRDRTLAALHGRELEYKYFVIDPAVYIDSSLMPVLGYCNKKKILLPKLEVDDMMFTNSSTAGFLYSNIVGNTMIDQTQSRLLATIPMSSKAGYSYFEFQNPTYRSLSVHSIADMTFVITDVQGNIFQMDNVYLRRRNFSEWILPTILNLHIRKRL
tara:strand:+ start:265 stop:1149 length:885 start_codon:yes stop_codon:yes gene_type:complete